MVHSILIIGQSNMAGRGFIADAEPLDTLDGRLRVMRNGRWELMYRPVNPDRPTAGICLAESFAKAYAQDHPDTQVGIIPCADGGTSLNQWAEGGLLFDNAIYHAKLAMRTSHLVGILWHQGEADCGYQLYPLYLEKITKIMCQLRKELGDERLPIVVGGLGEFLIHYPRAPHFENYIHINNTLKEFASTFPHTAFASAEGLKDNGDSLHFNDKSLLEFGLRYYDAFKTVEDKNRVFDEKSKMDDAIRTEMELL